MTRIRKLLSTIRTRIGKGDLVKALSVSVLNQIISSGTNFALGIYLVRTLSPNEFGLYGIGFAISLFYFGIGNAVFHLQMVVHSPDRIPEDRVPYAGRMLLLVLLFCAATVLLGAIVLIGSSILWEPLAVHLEFAGAIIATSVAYLLKDFFVRHAYNVRREILALIINSTVACLIILIIWAQYQFNAPMDAEMALWIYAVSLFGGAALGYSMDRLPITGHQRDTLVGSMREALRGGKWASVSNLLYFVRIQAHTIVVAALLGPAAVAKMSAARLLVTPAVMMIPALSQIAMPRLAVARKQGSRRLIDLGFLITIVLLTVVMFYCAVLLIGYDIIVGVVLGDRYHDLLVLTMLWCLYACFLALRNGAEMIVQAQKKFAALSGANTYSAVISLAATCYLTIAYSLAGALIGLTIGEVSLILLLYQRVLVQSRDDA